MRETGEVRKDLQGDEESASPYIGYARTLLGQLKNRAKLGGLMQLARRVLMPDGTAIEVDTRFGRDTIRIIAAAAVVGAASPVSVAQPAPPVVAPTPVDIDLDYAGASGLIVVGDQWDNANGVPWPTVWLNGQLFAASTLQVQPGQALDVSADGSTVLGYWGGDYWLGNGSPWQYFLLRGGKVSATISWGTGQATAIDGSGTRVAGWRGRGPSDPSRADVVVWSAGGFTVLPSPYSQLTGATYSRFKAVVISPNGQYVATTLDVNGDGLSTYPAYWKNGSGPYLLPTPSSSNGISSVNDQGLVAGSYDSGGNNVAIVWDTQHGTSVTYGSGVVSGLGDKAVIGWDTSTGHYTAWYLSPTGQVALPGDTGVVANGVTKDGSAICGTDNIDGYDQPALWHKQVKTRLPIGAGMYSGDAYACAVVRQEPPPGLHLHM